MMLSDVRDYIDSLGLAEHVYMGNLPDKQEKSIGVYNSKHQHAYKTAIGGPDLESYGTKYVTFLVHWNKSSRDTENAATVRVSAADSLLRHGLRYIEMGNILLRLDALEQRTNNEG